MGIVLKNADFITIPKALTMLQKTYQLYFAFLSVTFSGCIFPTFCNFFQLFKSDKVVRLLKPRMICVKICRTGSKLWKSIF